MQATSNKTRIEVILHKKDNNLDGKDNLDELPIEKAVYAICGRINGSPANCRYVGETVNLQEVVRKHFSQGEEDSCLKFFMQSIKTKVLIYELMPMAGEAELLLAKSQWEAEFKPECNDELNKIH